MKALLKELAFTERLINGKIKYMQTLDCNSRKYELAEDTLNRLMKNKKDIQRTIESVKND